MATPRLNDSEIDERLQSLPGWQRQDERLHRSFRFKDFVGAFGFMAQVALLAEAMNHHPEWRNVYNRVDIDLTTHDAGGISEKDFLLAARIDELNAA